MSKYDRLNPVVSWEKWITSQLNREGPSLWYDDSYESKYGDVTREVADRDGLMDSDDIAVVECVRGGRLFQAINEGFPVIYDDELYRLVKCAERHGVAELY